MSEDRFFQQVKSVMSDYQPEVPGQVYAGMRKKMWWSNFLRFDATRLNVWYVAVAVGATAAFLVNVNTPSTAAADSAVAPSVQQTEAVILPTEAPATNAVLVDERQPQPAVQATKKSSGSAMSSQGEATNPAEGSGTTDVAEVVEVKQTEQPKVEEPQHKKSSDSEVQAPAKSNKRGLKVKTYSTENEKK